MQGCAILYKVLKKPVPKTAGVRKNVKGFAPPAEV